jgi:uncharacterized protein (DUF1501 family)
LSWLHLNIWYKNKQREGIRIMKSHPLNSSRREFIKRASALSLAGSAAPWALNLAAMSEAAAQTATDYKALVCVFLYGGNDYGNTLIPYDLNRYNAYQATRPALAYPRDATAASPGLGPTALTQATSLPVGATDLAGLQYALAPELTLIKPIFDAGKMAVMLNVGTLIEPTTKTQYTNKSVKLPSKLFSHNDQQSTWQSSLPEGATSGWGGRMGDLFAAGNTNSTFTCVNVSGNAVFLSGKSAVQYQVTATGSVPINGIKSPLFGSQACSDALKAIITANSAQLFESEYARIAARSINANDALTTALAGITPLVTPFTTTNSLAVQLQMVARMIAARNTLGAKRQVFFVSIGGFDNHDGLSTVHPGLLTNVADALSSFYKATVELGISDKVTAFTASDFGRTLVPNVDGSDHGWGSHHFVLGGAVKGQAFYGAPPVISTPGTTVLSNDDIGQGRLLPSTSVDQFGGTLASWFGVSATDLTGSANSVLPDLANFTNKNLGFV